MTTSIDDTIILESRRIKYDQEKLNYRIEKIEKQIYEATVAKYNYLFHIGCNVTLLNDDVRYTVYQRYHPLSGLGIGLGPDIPNQENMYIIVDNSMTVFKSVKQSEMTLKQMICFHEGNIVTLINDDNKYRIRYRFDNATGKPNDENMYSIQDTLKFNCKSVKQSEMTFLTTYE